ncbi:MAG: hypothetical protein CMK07_11595 [Ponticaulis sp.]|nr:hypothetical protein [Ponticaulis sp.]
MRAIIHAGMHKTGTSSIQDTLAKIDHPDYAYLKWRSPNLSGLFAQQFYEPVEEYHSFKLSGQTREELLRERKANFLRMSEQLSQVTKPNLIFSAEDITAPNDTFGMATQKLADYLSNWATEFKVYAYVRTPSSFMMSAFQQRVKGSKLKNIKVDTLWPRYRDRLERLDKIFGQENVELVKFHRSEFKGGDVVTDFAGRLGISLTPDQIEQSNEGLSLEALALLFAQRNLGSGRPSGFKGSHKLNDQFIEKLSSIGSGKSSFSPEFLEPIFEANKDDLDWIENRLGAKLSDIPAPAPNQISCDEDLIAIAEANSNELDHALVELLSESELGRSMTAVEKAEKISALLKAKAGR